MKTITFLLAAFVLGANVAKASVVTIAGEKMAARFGANDPIEFNERGILFFVFPNGEFDFNTRPSDQQGGYFYKGAGRRGAINGNRMQGNYGVLIENDSYGRIRRVGNTFINYDYNNRVARIGSVFMRYNRFALVQVGGLQLVYNRFGTVIDSYGSVKGSRNQGFTNSYYGSGDNYYSGYQNNGGGYREPNDSDNDDNSTYYYKTDGTKMKVTDEKRAINNDSTFEPYRRK